MTYDDPDKNVTIDDPDEDAVIIRAGNVIVRRASSVNAEGA